MSENTNATRDEIVDGFADILGRYKKSEWRWLRGSPSELDSEGNTAACTFAQAIAVEFGIYSVKYHIAIRNFGQYLFDNQFVPFHIHDIEGEVIDHWNRSCKNADEAVFVVQDFAFYLKRYGLYKPMRVVRPAIDDPVNSVSVLDGGRLMASGKHFCVAPAIVPSQVDDAWNRYLENEHNLTATDTPPYQHIGPLEEDSQHDDQWDHDHYDKGDWVTDTYRECIGKLEEIFQGGAKEDIDKVVRFFDGVSLYIDKTSKNLLPNINLNDQLTIEGWKDIIDQ